LPAGQKARPPRDGSRDAEGEFGPYDGGSGAGAAGGTDADDCGGGGMQTCYLDFSAVPCGLLGSLTGAPGVGGALPESVQNAVVCAWSDCMGVNGALDSNGNPQKYVYLSNADGCAKDPANNSINCHVAFPGPSDGIFIGYSPALEPCGWDLACHAFVGFGDFFINGKPSGALELVGALAAGVVAYAPGTAFQGLTALGTAVGSAAANLPALGDYAVGYALSNPTFLADFANALTPWPGTTFSLGSAAGTIVSNWGTITGWAQRHW